MSNWPEHPPDRAVHLWVCTEVAHPGCDDHFDHLDGEERDRAQRFRFEVDRRRFAGSHLLLRHVLAHYLSCETTELAFQQNPWGKPALDGEGTREPDLHFSLSRSHDLALLGVSTGRELGADVERCLAQRSDSLIVERQFSAPEQDYVNGAPDRIAAFYEVWTRKEAYIKGLGYGLSHPLQEFSVEPDHAHPQVVRDWSRNRPGQNWYLQAVPLPTPGYAAALATPDAPLSFSVIPLKFSELALLGT